MGRVDSVTLLSFLLFHFSPLKKVVLFLYCVYGFLLLFPHLQMNFIYFIKNMNENIQNLNGTYRNLNEKQPKFENWAQDEI